MGSYSRLLVLIFLWCVPVLSQAQQAQTLLSSYTAPLNYAGCTAWGCGTIYRATQQEACNDGAAVYVSHGYTNVSATWTAGLCRYSINGGALIENWGVTPLKVCASGYTLSGAVCNINTASCPANSTLIGGSCACTSPYTSTGTQCAAPTCTAGASTSAGYYDVGTDPAAGSGAPPITTCDGACESVYSGDSIGFRQLVGGVYHYFAKGAYTKSGNTCTTGTATQSANTALPNATCGAGQQMIALNGSTKCFSSTMQSFADPHSAVAQTSTATTATTTTTTNINGASSVTTTSTLSSSGSGNGGGVVAVAGVAANDPLQAACAKDPTSPICKGASKLTAGALGTSMYSKGTLTSKTIDGAFSDFNNTLKASPMVSAINGFFTLNIPAGTCPTYSANIMGWTTTFDQVCQQSTQQWLLAAKAVLLLIFTYLAVRVAIL